MSCGLLRLLKGLDSSWSRLGRLRLAGNESCTHTTFQHISHYIHATGAGAYSTETHSEEEGAWKFLKVTAEGSSHCLKQQLVEGLSGCHLTALQPAMAGFVKHWSLHHASAESAEAGACLQVNAPPEH